MKTTSALLALLPATALFASAATAQPGAAARLSLPQVGFSIIKTDKVAVAERQKDRHQLFSISGQAKERNPIVRYRPGRQQ